MAISPELIKRVILDQREDQRWPKMYIQLTVQNKIDRLMVCLQLLKSPYYAYVPRLVRGIHRPRGVGGKMSKDHSKNKGIIVGMKKVERL